MATITFITPSGESRTVERADGSLMEAAVQNGVEGIDADCGGVCSCATCHVHVEPEWAERVGPPGPAEQALLELQDCANERSRLACQVQISEALGGLVVRVAPR
ncbi:MAG TPA: 2Fe-2S iron-sulfur cluster-binding protein [Kiritimatiellia bacterium]|nr:2Fe-2S iron-sulfur cluster-binding protein [Kiritimatiellia bacterium]